MDNGEIAILYGPRDGKHLRRLYPELDESPFFKDIANEDLLFAWYIGIPGSPIDADFQENIRVKEACRKCFPTNPEKRQKFMSGGIPEKIKLAIEEFKRKSPEARLMAKMMTQRTFLKFQQLLEVDVNSDFKVSKTVKNELGEKETITETDWTGRKQYVDSATKIIEVLPDLVKKIEEGFGILDKKKLEAAKGTKSIDKFHENNEENLT